MTDVIMHGKAIQKTHSSLIKRLVDLFSHRHWGNMGPELYRNGGATKFEKILTSEYSPYAGEQRLIDRNLDQIIAWAGNLQTAVLIGPGPSKSVKAKELKILEGMPHLKKVIVIELSPEFNRQSTNAIKLALPNVEITSLVSDFREVSLDRKQFSPALVISTGSMTNFEDIPLESFPQEQVRDHLVKIADLAGKEGKFLWGYDSSLDVEQYHSEEISDFILHPLEKVSAFQSTVVLDPTGLKHETVANTQASCLLHKWVVTKDQEIQLGNFRHSLFFGDVYTAFASAKLSPDKLQKIAQHVHMSMLIDLRDSLSGANISGFECK